MNPDTMMKRSGYQENHMMLWCIDEIPFFWRNPYREGFREYKFIRIKKCGTVERSSIFCRSSMEFQRIMRDWAEVDKVEYWILP